MTDATDSDEGAVGPAAQALRDELYDGDFVSSICFRWLKVMGT